LRLHTLDQLCLTDQPFLLNLCECQKNGDYRAIFFNNVSGSSYGIFLG
jgi:hypothetical protein